MNFKKIEVKKGGDIPPKSSNKFNFENNISDWYFAKCKAINGSESRSVVCYDFKNKQWGFVSSGISEVVEYYVGI